MSSPKFKTTDQRYKAPAPPRDHSGLDGILLVDKPAGPTSHDIVHAIQANPVIAVAAAAAVLAVFLIKEKNRRES